ncbi:MAG: hypothetical protein QXL85_02395 [Candidatus Bathyarchaeia archaeon]
MMDKEGKISKASILLMIVVLIMLIIALAEIFSIIGEYMAHRAFNPVSIALSLGTILLSVYLLFQIIKKPKDHFFEAQRITTMVRCTSCDYVTAREFEKGDYVLKETGTCPKCGGNLIIYSIFREVRDEE